MKEALAPSEDDLGIPEFLRRDSKPKPKKAPPAKDEPDIALAVLDEMAAEEKGRTPATKAEDQTKKLLGDIEKAKKTSVPVKSSKGVVLNLKTHTSAGMDADSAAAHAADVMEALGKPPKNRSEFISYVSAIIGSKDQMSATLAEATGIDADQLIPHVRALATREQAREAREDLKRYAPNKADLIDTLMNNTRINKTWRK
jgi:hypothetical protein